MSVTSVAPASDWWLGTTAARAPEARALNHDTETVTYRELAETSGDLALVLAASGVGRGDRFVWLGRASRQAVETLHAAQKIGAALAPLSVRSTVGELSAQASRIHPRVVVSDAENHDRAAKIARAVGCGLVATEDLSRLRRAKPTLERTIDPSAPLALLCTSGTTGLAKVVALSNANCHASALAAGRRLDYGGAQAWLATLPIHHVGGLSILLRAAIFGVEVVLRDGFDAVQTRDDIVRYSIRHASLVPTMLHRLLATAAGAAEPAGALAGCCFLVGGAALSAGLARRAADAGLDVRATYGMTEAASQVATTESGEVLSFPETAGRPLDGVQLRVEMPDREGYGDIVVAGDMVFDGYFDDAAATCEVLRDGALVTGDIGRVDGDGRLYVTSRRVDLIVTGGENVRPEEIERALEAHPAVVEAGVYGIPDEEWGQRVAAVVVPRDGSRINALELEQWCRARVSAFKIPRRIDTVRSLPRTAGGKLMRNRLHTLK